VPSELLNPRNAWADKAAYDRQVASLAARFDTNFARFDAPAAVRAAGPRARR
jgi:phosphoenolpyruvate carboxykinase (ATP)